MTVRGRFAMRKLHSPEQLEKYIMEYKLQSLMNASISQIAELQEFKKGEFLIRSDVPSRYLYFLVKGETIVTCTTNDRTLCIDYMRPLAWVGEAASLWNTPPSCEVQALEECICIAIDLTVHRNTLSSDLLFLQNTCQLLACKLNAIDFSPRTLLEPLSMRLAKFILCYSSQEIFTFRLTNCALILNTSYRHLLRMIKKFCQEGILERKTHGYLIKNKNRLIHYSENYDSDKKEGSDFAER